MCACVCVCVCVAVCVSACVCVHVFMYIYVRTHVHVSAQRNYFAQSTWGQTLHQLPNLLHWVENSRAGLTVNTAHQAVVVSLQ